MAIREPKVSIDFYMSGKICAHRYWFHVPRVGDEITLKDSKSGADTTYKIIRVVWGVEREDDPCQGANIQIKKVAF